MKKITVVGILSFFTLFVFGVVATYGFAANSNFIGKQIARLYGQVTIQNDAQSQYFLYLSNRNATQRAYIDSAGGASFTASALTGLTTLDSAKVNGIVKIGGQTSNGTSTIYVKALSTRLNILSMFTDVQRFAVDTSGGVKGSTFLSDTAAFSTTATRLAINIPGAAQSDKYIVSKRSLSETLPDSDAIGYWAKAESLIVLRRYGVTSGLKISYVRIR